MTEELEVPKPGVGRVPAAHRPVPEPVGDTETARAAAEGEARADERLTLMTGRG